MMADTIARFKEGKPVIYYTDAVLGQRRAEAGQRCGLAAGSVLPLPGVQKNIDTKLANGANYGFRSAPCTS